MARMRSYTVEIAVGFYGSWGATVPPSVEVKASTIPSAVQKALKMVLGVRSTDGMWRIQIKRNPLPVEASKGKTKRRGRRRAAKPLNP